MGWVGYGSSLGVILLLKKELYGSILLPTAVVEHEERGRATEKGKVKRLLTPSNGAAQDSENNQPGEGKLPPSLTFEMGVRLMM